jgi:vanillate/3-O-methylgallate O-demethylase
MYADRVLRNGQDVGVTTSRGYSVYFREMLSLCTIDVEHADIGNEVTVIWGEPGSRQKAIRAKVAAAPYKQDNRRADLTSV